MLKHVLAVARAVFKPAQQLDKLVMQPVYPALEYSLLAGLAYLHVHFFSGLLDHFLYPCGVYAPVKYKLFKRYARYLPAHGIKARKYNGLRSIVYYKVNARSGLKRSYVPALAADYAALHLVIRQRNNAYRSLRNMIRRAPLYSQRDYVPRPLVSLLLGLRLYLPEHQRRLMPCVALNAFKQNVLGLVHAHSGYCLKLLELLILKLLYLSLDSLYLLLLLYGVLLALLYGFYLFIKHLFLLEEPALTSLYLVASFPVLALILAFKLVDLLLGL